MIDETKLKQAIFKPLEDWQLLQMSRPDGLDSRDNIALQIEKDIEEYCLQAYQESEPRSHLGASVAGHECDRYIWYHFRWVKHEKFSARKLRIFQRGHREEDYVIQLLRGIGCQVIQIEDGKQIRIARDEAEGHFGGSCDSIIIMPERYGLGNLRFLLEIKTANSQWFKDLKNLGVMKANERYYKQQCIYGYKLELEYALFFVVGKNDDDNSIEILKLDHELGKETIDKTDDIIHQYYPPKRMPGASATFYRCKWCPAHKQCFLDEPYEKNCRSCKFAQPVADGQWMCHNFKQIIPSEHLIKGCEQWESLPK